jgi:hypothetical protein
LRWPNGGAWDALQVHQPATDRGALFVFNPPAATTDRIALSLRGLDPARSYRLTSGVSGEEWTATGEALKGEGIHRAMAPGTSDVFLVDPA